MWGGGGDRDPPGIWVREEPPTETLGLDLVGRVGRLGEVAVHSGRGGR